MIFQSNDSEKALHSSTLNSSTIDNEEEEEEDDDVRKKEEPKVFPTEDISDTNAHKSESGKMCKDKAKSQDGTKIDSKSKNTSRDIKANEHRTNVEDDRKRKKGEKSDKSSKNIKWHYDQDIHSEDYSTWVPPQNQSGDGRTSLNDKYGY